MSNSDNLQKKVLSTTALKTNFISNTTQKITQPEKRFSHISKDKALQNQFKHTVQKNTARYYEQMDMQGSATILPQKNSSRKNIYMNQNSNLNSHIPSNQRKESNPNLVLNNYKAKSPIDKNRINSQNNTNSTTNHITIPISHTIIPTSNNLPTTSNHLPISINDQNMIPSQSQNMLTNASKNINNRISQALTDREKPHRQGKEQHALKEHHNKMKSLIFNNNRKQSTQIDDLICDEEMEIAIIPQKQHTRKLSTHLPVKNESKLGLLQTDSFTEQSYKTQKKHPIQKGSMMLQKTKSQHNISTKQLTNTATLMPVKPISHLLCNSNQIQPQPNTTSNTIFQPQPRLQQKLQLNIHSCQQQLRRFMHLQSELDINCEIETIMRLENRQRNYLVQPNYIQCRQKNFNWFMRAVLMDWMVHVCYQFGLKRQTYYISVAIADKYLEKTNDLPKSDFQLVGAASMFIAAKLQEFQALSSGDFSKSTDNRYSPVEIRQMELKICRAMSYQLNPPTLYMWANRFMAHWDSYIQQTNAKYHPYFQSHKTKYFKKDSQQSYLLFRQLMQYLDCSILDVQTLQFAPKTLVCSFIYLVLGKNYKQWPLKRIVDQFPRTSHYLLQQDQPDSFNSLFHMFLAESFQIDLIELLPAIQYCSTYFTLPLNYDSPSYALKNQSPDQAQLSLEQYESFQTYNGKMIDLIKKRYRGVYP